MSNSPERTGPAGTYESGEIVSLSIPDATVFHQGDRLTVVVDDVYITVPASAVIKRVTPSHGQPQPGDIWTDAVGTEWFATDRPGTRGLMFQPANGMAESWPNVNDATGPLRLTYRPIPAEPPPADDVLYPVPVPATPSDLAAAFPADPHVTAAMELTPTGQLAEPVTECERCNAEGSDCWVHRAPIGSDDLGPELAARLAVILDGLHGLYGDGDEAVDAYVRGLPEFGGIASFGDADEIDAFNLRGIGKVAYVAIQGWQRVAS